MNRYQQLLILEPEAVMFQLVSLLHSWHYFSVVNTWSTVQKKGYFCVMYTEHLSQKNCWSILVLQCHIIIYIWIKNLFGTVFLMDGKRTKNVIVVEMKFPWNTLNWKLALSNHSCSHLLSVTCQKVQFTLQQILQQIC